MRVMRVGHRNGTWGAHRTYGETDRTSRIWVTSRGAVVNVRIFWEHRQEHLLGPLRFGRLSKKADLHELDLNNEADLHDRKRERTWYKQQQHRRIVGTAANGPVVSLVKLPQPLSVTVVSRVILLQVVGKKLRSDEVDLSFRKIELPRQVELFLIRSM